MKYKQFHKEGIRDLLVNIASAWFIGGIVAVYLEKQALTWQLISGNFISLILTIVSIQFIFWL